MFHDRIFNIDITLIIYKLLLKETRNIWKVNKDIAKKIFRKGKYSRLFKDNESLLLTQKKLR